jgi:hypothetical protein
MSIFIGVFIDASMSVLISSFGRAMAYYNASILARKGLTQ